MYELYTRQALPNKEYRALLGSAICVFNSNVSFIIENIRRVNHGLSWFDLIDLTAGKLSRLIENDLALIDESICADFKILKEKRDRIVHSFQVTKNGEQILATKDKQNKQFVITEKYLIDFIKQNESLCDKLYEIRKKLRTVFSADFPQQMTQ